jgi:hypothetical protein
MSNYRVASLSSHMSACVLPSLSLKNAIHGS